MSIQERFEQILRTNELVAEGDTLLVAVSGGADSIALLTLLSRLATDFPFALVAAHLDHQLRSESSDDADFVVRYCAELNIPVVVERKDVARFARESGAGLEEAGRQARRQFFERVADVNGCSAIVLGHHADDQAETVLFRMQRGSGLSGLSAMRMKSGPYIRPLLSLRHSELREYLHQEGIDWREDASNDDLTFTRNRIRHQLLPQLHQLNPQIVNALTRLSRQAADEEDYWASFSAAFLDQHGHHGDDGFEIPVSLLMAFSRAERRRVLRAFLRQVKEPLVGIDSGHIEQVEDCLMAARPQADLDLPGLWVGRRYDRLLCAAKMPEAADYEISICAPGEYLLPTGALLRVESGKQLVDLDDVASAQFCAEQVPFPITVRSPRAGDRFQPSGMSGTKLLKDYFVDAKVDRESRQRTPVVCCGKEVIWLAGRRRCEQFRPVVGKKLLKITLLGRNRELNSL